VTLRLRAPCNVEYAPLRGAYPVVVTAEPLCPRRFCTQTAVPIGLVVENLVGLLPIALSEGRFHRTVGWCYNESPESTVWTGRGYQRGGSEDLGGATLCSLFVRVHHVSAVQSLPG
jgi:hypothetical protein